MEQGMVLLWITSAIPQARPYCDKSLSRCDSPTAFQRFVLYSCFVLMCIGGGGIKASSLAFGGDQLATNKNKHILESFIGWYYVFTLVGSLFGMTVIVYIQDNISWSLGFGIPAALMLFFLVSFLLVSPLFVKIEPSSSLFTSLFQVVVAAYRNRHVRLPSDTSHALYHHGDASARQKPSDKLRYACTLVAWKYVAGFLQIELHWHRLDCYKFQNTCIKLFWRLNSYLVGVTRSANKVPPQLRKGLIHGIQLRTITSFV